MFEIKQFIQTPTQSTFCDVVVSTFRFGHIYGESSTQSESISFKVYQHNQTEYIAKNKQNLYIIGSFQFENFTLLNI